MSNFYETKNEQKNQYPLFRTERFANNSMVTVVTNSHDSFQFLRQIAILKNVQVRQ